MTPHQKSMPKQVISTSFDRVPETCHRLRAILDDLKHELMNEFDIDASDEASIDSYISNTFICIRDEVVHPLRDDQMSLIFTISKSLG